MSYNLSTNPNIVVCSKSTLAKTGTEVFTLFYDDENSHHLTGCKNIAGVFSYYDYEVPFTGGITYKGVIDASANPNFPAAIVGDMYIVSVAGTICGIPVNVGDMIISTAVQASGCVPANWTIIEANGVNWQLDGNAVASEKFIGTTTPFNFPIRTNNVQRATYTSAGFYGFGTNTPLVNYDIRGEGQIWKNTTVINPIAGIADKGFTVEYTTALTVNPYIVGNGGIITYTSVPAVSSGGVFGTFGMIYFNDTSASSLTGISGAPVLSGIAGKVWIEQSDSAIDRVAGVSSYYAVRNGVIGGTVTAAHGFWCGWDDIVNDATITTNYYGYFMPDLSAIVGVTPASNRWGIYIEDNSNNYLRGKTKLGTGTSTTGHTLEVEGTLKFVTGVPGVGKVLTSDATGVATWVTPAFSGIATIAQGGTNTGTQTANQILYYDGSKITSDLFGVFNPVAQDFYVNFTTGAGVGVLGATRISYLGDYNNDFNSTRVIVDDTNQEIIIKANIITLGSSSIQYEFPLAQGAANTFLKNNGAGILTWSTLPVAATGQIYTPTNVTTDRAYNADATTIDEIADVLGSLIIDLQTSGIIS